MPSHDSDVKGNAAKSHVGQTDTAAAESALSAQRESAQTPGAMQRLLRRGPAPTPGAILRLQATVGNGALARMIAQTHNAQLGSAVDARSASESPTVQRQDDPGAASPTPTDGSSGAGSDTTAKLRAILESLQNLYTQTKDNLSPEQTNDTAGDGTVAQQFGVVESAIGQISAAISSTDEALRSGILAAFTPAAIMSATSQAGATIPIDARASAPVGATAATTPVAQRLARSLALEFNYPEHPAEVVSAAGSSPMLHAADTTGTVQRMAAIAAPLIAFEAGGGAEAEAASGPVGWAVGAVIGLAILVAIAIPSDEATPSDSTSEMATAVQGERASGQLTNIARHLARLLALGSVGGVPSGEPPKNNNDDDKHWWNEIKGSIQQFLQAVKGASRKQIMRELLKRGWTEDAINEIIAKLAEAAKLMGEDPPDILPPP